MHLTLKLYKFSTLFVNAILSHYFLVKTLGLALFYCTCNYVFVLLNSY